MVNAFYLDDYLNFEENLQTLKLFHALSFSVKNFLENEIVLHLRTIQKSKKREQFAFLEAETKKEK